MALGSNGARAAIFKAMRTMAEATSTTGGIFRSHCIGHEPIHAQGSGSHGALAVFPLLGEQLWFRRGARAQWPKGSTPGWGREKELRLRDTERDGASGGLPVRQAHRERQRQRAIIRSRFPEREQRHRELAGDGDHGTLFGELATTRGDAFARRAERARRAEGAEDIMGAVDEQAAQRHVAGLGDAELLVGLPDWSRRGTRPRYGPTARACAKCLGSSSVRTKHDAVSGPTPGICRSRSVAG
jgi:hypothetical protein